MCHFARENLPSVLLGKFGLMTKTQCVACTVPSMAVWTPLNLLIRARGRALGRMTPYHERPPYCPCAPYFASVASLAGLHQASLSRYHAIVAARPSAKSVCAGAQPSSRRSLAESIA